MLITETTLRRIIKEELDKETESKILQIYFNSSAQGITFAEMMAPDLLPQLTKHHDGVKRFISYAEETWPPAQNYRWYSGNPEYDNATRTEWEGDMLRFKLPDRAKEFKDMWNNAWIEFETPATMGSDRDYFDALKQWAGV